MSVENSTRPPIVVRAYGWVLLAMGLTGVVALPVGIIWPRGLGPEFPSFRDFLSAASNLALCAAAYGLCAGRRWGVFIALALWCVGILELAWPLAAAYSAGELNSFLVVAAVQVSAVLTGLLLPLAVSASRNWPRLA
jgi:hypothetical protein